MSSMALQLGTRGQALMRWWPWPVLLAAGALLVWSLTQSLWVLLRPLPDPPPLSSGSIARDVAAAPIPLARYHLFGPAPGSLAAYPDAPETTLALKLKGTYATHESEQARALIAENNGNEKTYRVGSALPGGARVRAIYPDRVILDANGRIEVLRLRTGAAAMAAASDRNPGAAADAPPAPAGLPTTQSGLLGFAAPNGGVQPVVAAVPVDWEDVRRQVNADPQSFAQAFTVLPVMIEGKLAGVRVSSNQYGDLLANAGLRAEDVVVAVNGRALTGVESGLAALDALKSQGSVTLTIRRDGQEQTLPAIRLAPGG